MADAADGSDGRAAERPGEPSRRAATLAEIRETYAEQAGRMARLDPLNRLLTGRYRRRLFSRAQGRTLDVACGTAVNRRYLPADTPYVGVDASPEMLSAAARLDDGLAVGEDLLVMDAQALAFPDDSFDTVVSALSTCTFPDPVAALREMGRVCEPDGRILLLEHGRSHVGPLSWLQDWRADAHFEKHACRLTQEPLDIVAEAGLHVEEASTAMLGVVTAIVARPARP